MYRIYQKTQRPVNTVCKKPGRLNEKPNRNRAIRARCAGKKAQIAKTQYSGMQSVSGKPSPSRRSDQRHPYGSGGSVDGGIVIGGFVFGAAVGSGVGVGRGVAVGVGAGVAVGASVGVGAGVAVGVTVGVGAVVAVGFAVGVAVTVGVAVGVGFAVGVADGADVPGFCVGFAVGVTVGAAVGVGASVGSEIGVSAGASVGSAVSASVGSAVGASVGTSIGSAVACGASVGSDNGMIVLFVCPQLLQASKTTAAQTAAAVINVMIIRIRNRFLRCPVVFFSGSTRSFAVFFSGSTRSFAVFFSGSTRSVSRFTRAAERPGMKYSSVSSSSSSAAGIGVLRGTLFFSAEGVVGVPQSLQIFSSGAMNLPQFGQIKDDKPPCPFLRLFPLSARPDPVPAAYDNGM